MEIYLHCAIGMIPCRDEYEHAWVKHSEAQAEIERLQKEVERLKNAYINATEKRMPEAITTAHNDAIEAAANSCEMLGDEFNDMGSPAALKVLDIAASRIRVLKR